MGRKETNPVRKLFFTYNVDSNESTCNIVGCHRPILKGYHSHNLETHIRSSHPHETQILIKAKEDYVSQKNQKCLFKGTSATLASKKRGPLDEVITTVKKSLYIKMDQISLLKACTEMVTENGRPLTIFNDSGFRKILNPLIEAIGEGFTINSLNIKKHIFSASDMIIREITNDVKNNLFSLKIDCVKRHNRSIIGVNIQYIKDGRVCLATLAMREIYDQHTSENLKKLLLQLLSIYNIKKEQIYTITCDNAANMVKLARIMNENNECEVTHHDIKNEIVIADNDFDSDFEYDNGKGSSLSKNDIENELFDDEFENNDESNSDFQDIVITALEPKTITSCIRCSVHSLQLCIQVGLKSAPINKCIVQARAIVKKLRTPKYASRLKKMNLKYAIIDIETRWSSMYNMLFRLLELKDFCKSLGEIHSELRLCEYEWESIQSIIDTLHPVKEATLALQKQDLSLGDFYGIWLKTINGLRLNNSTLAATIKMNMEKEIEDKYLTNSTFLAGIFIDPRYQFLLTSEQNSLAIDRLVETWETLHLLNETNSPNETLHLLNETNSPNDSNSFSSVATSSDCVEIISLENGQNFEEEDPFEFFLSSQSSNLSQSSTASNTSTQQITNILNEFKNVNRIPHSTHIMQYWESKKETNPELYSLACILLAVPATQVSVERSFSGLKFILNDLRASLDTDLLEAIMIVRCNKQFKKFY